MIISSTLVEYMNIGLSPDGDMDGDCTVQLET